METINELAIEFVKIIDELFKSNGFDCKKLYFGEEIYYCARDILSCLEYYIADTNVKKVLDQLSKEDKFTIKELKLKYNNSSHSWQEWDVFKGHGQYEKGNIYVNEQGLYFLIGNSNKKEAEPFKNFVYRTLLPELKNVYKNLMKKQKEEISQKDTQLLEKEEEIKLRIQSEKEKEEELKKEKELVEQLKEYSERIQTLEKTDIIYIVTNEDDIKNNIFKLGKTKLGSIKKRLSVYNTGASKPYYYVNYFEVFNGDQVEKTFYDNMKRYNIKVNSKLNKEIYQLYLPDMELCLKKVIDSSDSFIEYLNENHQIIFFNSKNKKSEAIPKIIPKKNKKCTEETIEETIEKNSESEESLETEEIKQKIYNLLDNYIKKNELNIIRKNFIDSLNLNEYNKVRIWNIIKEILDWKNSKTNIVYGSKKITITY